MGFKMDGKQKKLLMIVVLGGLIASAAINYFYLKSTVEWPEQDDIVSLEYDEEENGLNLTWDISGDSGPKGVQSVEQVEKNRKLEEQKQRESTINIVDSLLVQETSPIEENLENTQADLMETQVQIDELERLVAMIATRADSVDNSNARRLSKIIEQMSPTDAAGIMNGLGDRTNAELLLKMKQRQAARILAAMPRERAASVAKYLSRAYQRSSI
jgi:flagellar motility protein MotE (MotC chaperone)